jgi:hypothetical protein
VEPLRRRIHGHVTDFAGCSQETISKADAWLGARSAGHDTQHVPAAIPPEVAGIGGKSYDENGSPIFFMSPI